MSNQEHDPPSQDEPTSPNSGGAWAAATSAERLAAIRHNQEERRGGLWGSYGYFEPGDDGAADYQISPSLEIKPMPIGTGSTKNPKRGLTEFVPEVPESDVAKGVLPKEQMERNAAGLEAARRLLKTKNSP